MASEWNMFVKKIYEEGVKKHGKTYQFKDALKDASKRKGEMSMSTKKKSAKNEKKQTKRVSKKGGRKTRKNKKH